MMHNKGLITCLCCGFLLVGCVSAPTNSPKITADHIAKLNPEHIEKHAKEFGVVDNFYYKQLNDEEKRIYLAIYTAAKDRQNNVILPGEVDGFIKAREALELDNADVSWAQNNDYKIRNNTSNTKYESYEVYDLFSEPMEELHENIQMIEDKITEVVKSIPEGTVYDKVKYVFEYVVNYLEYNYDDTDNVYNQNLINALKEQKTVCTGYAKFFAAILKKAGISAVLIPGDIKPSEDKPGGLHVWVMVDIDGQYYHVDPTWGDSTQGVDYNYLCVDEEDLKKTHEIVSDVSQRYYKKYDLGHWQFPAVANKSLNYHILNGTYFNNYIRGEITSFIANAIRSGKTQVHFRFATPESWNAFNADIQEVVNALAYQYGLYEGWLRVSHPTFNAVWFSKE